MADPTDDANPLTKHLSAVYEVTEGGMVQTYPPPKPVDDDLAAADAFDRLQNAAFPGPWFRVDPPWGDGTHVGAGPSEDPHSHRIVVCEFDGFSQQFNSEFDGTDSKDIPEHCNVQDNMALIAASRTTDLPSRIRRLVAENAELRRDLAHECPKCQMSVESSCTQDGCVGCEVKRLKAALEQTITEMLGIPRNDIVDRINRICRKALGDHP